MGKVGPDAVNGSALSVRYVRCRGWVIKPVSKGDLFFEPKCSQHGGHRAGSDIPIGVHSDDDLLFVLEPGFHLCFEVL